MIRASLDKPTEQFLKSIVFNSLTQVLIEFTKRLLKKTLGEIPEGTISEVNKFLE